MFNHHKRETFGKEGGGVTQLTQALVLVSPNHQSYFNGDLWVGQGWGICVVKPPFLNTRFNQLVIVAS